MLCDVSQPNWPILLVDPAWQKLMGCCTPAAVGRGFWELFQQDSSGQESCCRYACMMVHCMSKSNHLVSGSSAAAVFA